jgi:drug/metabolite transporter (DMT)-like permease
MTSRKADFIFIGITLIWGATFPFIKESLAYTNADWFVAMRFMLAALIMLPFVWRRLWKINLPVFFIAAIIGLLTGFGYYAQTVGLKTIGSAESAFITSTTVILIPLLLPFFRMGKPHWLEALAAGLCLLGVYVLTGANLANLSVADAWTFVCALTTAIGVILIQRYSPKVSDYAVFAFLQILFAGLIPLGLSLYHGQAQAHWSGALWMGLIYCAVLATAVTFFLQNRFQQYTNPTKVGVIFAFEPVFACGFAFVFNHETLHTSTFLGGGIILLSLVLAELKGLLK